MIKRIRFGAIAVMALAAIAHGDLGGGTNHCKAYSWPAYFPDCVKNGSVVYCDNWSNTTCRNQCLAYCIDLALHDCETQCDSYNP